MTFIYVYIIANDSARGWPLAKSIVCTQRVGLGSDFRKTVATPTTIDLLIACGGG